jgi:hypothetical protein
MVHGKLLVSAAALTILAGVPPLYDARGDAAQGIAAEVPAGEWRSAPEYVRLFTPLRAHTESYGAYVSPRDVGDVIRQLENDPSLLHPPGAWRPDSSRTRGLPERELRSSQVGAARGARRAGGRGPRSGGRPIRPGR